MYRTLFAAAVLVLTALTASAADPARSRGAALPTEETPRHYDLRSLFEQAPGVIETDGDGVTVSAFAFEVVVARFGPNGEMIKACVDNEHDAQKFLTAPFEKIQKKEQEQ